MTPADDLRPGMWVAIVGREEPEEETSGQWSFTAWPMARSTRSTVAYTGEPLQILAISLPFLCVFGGGKRFAIDLRSRDVQRLSKRFVRAMLAKPPKTKESEQLQQVAGPFDIPHWVLSK